MLSILAKDQRTVRTATSTCARTDSEVQRPRLRRTCYTNGYRDLLPVLRCNLEARRAYGPED